MRYLVVLVIAITQCLCQENFNWEEEPEWSFQTYLNEDVMIKCNDSSAMLMENDELVWKLPNMADIHGYSGRNTEKHELMLDNGIMGGILKVKKVAAADKGLYFCDVTRQGVHYKRIIRGLNLYRHLEREPFEMYRVNLVTAVIAAAVFVVPLLGLCFIYHYRFQTEQQKDKRSRKQQYFLDLQEAVESGSDFPTKPSSNGVDNQGYINTHL